jgi:hypothetical protein
MPTRRVSGAPGEAERYSRIMTKVESSLESITDRLEQFAENFDSRLDRIEAAIRIGEQGRLAIMGEVAELRHDQGELRDLVTMSRVNTADAIDAQNRERAPAMARAVAVATDQKVVPAVSAAIKSSPSLRGKAAMAGAIFGAFSAGVLALEHVPEVLRFLVRLGAIIMGWK